MKKCDKCGANNLDDAAVCNLCNAPLGAPANGAAPPPMAPPPESGSPHLQRAQQVQPRTSGFAIASLVLGLLCGGGLLLPLAFGIIALVQIGNNQGALRGRGMAIAGLVLSIFFPIVTMIMAAIYFPVFSQAREKARETSCMSNQKQITQAALMYAVENEEMIPDAATLWQSVPPKVLRCSNADMNNAYSYGYNVMLTGKGLGQIRDATTTILCADNKSSTGLIRSQADIDARHKGKRGFIAGYMDGHVELVMSGQSPMAR